MKVTLGVHLDTGVWPHPLWGRQAFAGETVLGPAGFLQLLETHLGLGGRPASECFRTAAFLNHLRDSDDKRQFYHRSFWRDPWGVSRELLAWQDELVEGGWHGRPMGMGRLKTLTTLPRPDQASVAERVNRVGRSHVGVVEELILADPIEGFSPAWQRLLRNWQGPLRRLPTPPLSPRCYTDLSRLQYSEPGLVGDGTVVHVQGASPWEAAEVVAAWLASQPSQMASSVVLCEARGDILDSALRRQGLPCLGSNRSSPFRPATQVLPLLVSLGWKPLDPYRLLEFLKLPRTPLPVGRHILAQALQESPGLGGPAWHQAWEKAKALEGGEKLEPWLGGIVPLGSFEVRDGMPAETVRAAAGQVARWAMGLLALPEWRNDAPLQAARDQASSLQRILSDWGKSPVPARHLERILADLAGVGIVSPLFVGEVGRLCRVASPGAILGPADTIIWWNFVQSDSNYPAAPWTGTELEVIRQHQVVLESTASRCRREADTWQQPVQWARQRLVLVSWKAQGHAPVRAHPWLDEMRGTYGDALDSLARVELLGALPWEDLPHRTVPALQPLWTVAPDLVAPRALESASSMETLLQCPLRWTLTYPAQVHGRVLAGLADESILAGNVAHAVLEHVLMVQPRPSAQDAMRIARAEFDRRVSEEAATLLLASRKTLRLMVRDLTARASATLVGMVAFDVTGVEVERSAVVDGIALEGRLDVLLTDRRTQEPIVLDLKWSPARAVSKLRAGSAVQLAVYSGIVGTDSAGYFSIRDGHLHLPPGTAWPGHPIPGPSMAETRARVWATWHRRMSQVTGGTIEVTAAFDIDRDSFDGDQLVLRPPCRYCEHRLFCGVS
ncbi:MAG TPA: PD-(D/E)XK nuclease family protein [Candidatus Xenobia bacterium]